MTCGRACTRSRMRAKHGAQTPTRSRVASCILDSHHHHNLPDAVVKVYVERLFIWAAAILPLLVSLFIKVRQTSLVPALFLSVKPWTLGVGARGSCSGRAAGVLFFHSFKRRTRFLACELVLIAFCAVEGLVAVAASPAVITALAVRAAALFLAALSS